MKLMLLVAGVAAHDSWTDYKNKYQKWYNGDEDDARKAVYENHLVEIDQHNSENTRWEAGVNQFSDMEDVSAFLGFTGADFATPNTTVPTVLAVAASKDWRSRMPSVKNQGGCGSCWTFSATAVVDFFSGVSHSEQQVGDCTTSNLCNGGNPYTALDYLAQGHKHATTSAYPYKGYAASCKSVSSGASVQQAHQTSGYSNIMNVVQNQVAAVGFYLSGQNSPFMSYKNGVYDQDCGTGAGHAVAIVGYNSDYWIVRNSWGSSWGVSGYFYFKKGSNLCSMENYGWYATGVSASESVVV